MVLNLEIGRLPHKAGHSGGPGHAAGVFPENLGGHYKGGAPDGALQASYCDRPHKEMQVESAKTAGMGGERNLSLSHWPRC